MEIFKPYITKWLELLERENYPETTRFSWPEYDNWTTNDILILGNYASEIMIPKLASDFGRYRRSIAHLLSLVDSRKLNPRTRELIGLKKNFTPDQINNNLPELVFRAGYRNWNFLCGESEDRLLECWDRLGENKTFYLYEKLEPSILFEALGCLSLKVNGFTAGLCFETKEFANGAVFIEEIWYRTDMETEKKIIDVCQHFRNGVSQKENVYEADGNLIVLEDLGGNWEPVRGLNQRGDPVPTSWL